MNISALILAGGKGRRMKTTLPKQFLPLCDKPVACHSVSVVWAHPLVKQIIVVCAQQYRALFASSPVHFAEPGKRRQDSVFNGLQQAEHPWICIHDAARPYLTLDLLSDLIDEGKEVGAAALGVPVKNTIKVKDPKGFVSSTPARNTLWEVQTPQLLKKEVLEKGFLYANNHALTVTDDVSLAELIGHPVKLVQSSYQNRKLTTPEDLWQDGNLSSPMMAATM